MRTIIFTFTLLVGIIVFSWFTLSYLEDTSQEMLSLVDSLEKIVTNENWAAAEKPLKSISSLWEKVEKRWTIILNHSETDEIELTVAKLKSYIKSEELGDSLAELSALKFLLQHIPGKHHLQLHNIF
ncbi:MAG: DUF4363 family protein [Bacillota bacterium]